MLTGRWATRVKNGRRSCWQQRCSPQSGPQQPLACGISSRLSTLLPTPHCQCRSASIPVWKRTTTLRCRRISKRKQNLFSRGWMYPSHPYGLFSRSRGYAAIADRDWRHGGVSWTQDYPPRRPPFRCGLCGRLTRVHTRSAEQPVNPDDGDDIFNWPFLAAGEMAIWKLNRRTNLEGPRVSAARRLP